jgi:hypothetical protein
MTGISRAGKCNEYDDWSLFKSYGVNKITSDWIRRPLEKRRYVK